MPTMIRDATQGQKSTLDKLAPGQRALVESLETQGLTRRRLLDLGLVPGTVVEFVQKSPLGDPTAYRIRGAVIALRSEEGRNIGIRLL